MPPDGGAPALHVSGNTLLTSSGAAYKLYGVNRSGGEFACIQGNGIWNGPMDQASVAAIRSWKVRAVRVPLNEERWLGTGDVQAQYGGTTYQNAVKAYVNLLVANGITPIVEMHWNYGQYTGPSAGSSDVKATCQKPMPDAQYAPSFWTGVATRSRPPTRSCSTCSTSPIRSGPTSSSSGTSCYDSQLAPVAARVPLTLTEIGENDCAHGFVDALMGWADSHGIGYLGWTWNNRDCGSGPSLITDYDGTPTAYGQGLENHLATVSN